MAEKFEKLLQKAYKTVASLEPITPDASPSKKDLYLAKVTTYAKWINMMQSHVDEVLTASGVNESTSDSATSAKPQTTLMARVASRVASILDEVDQQSEALPLREWIDLIISPRKMTFYVAEQQGFVRLLRGYRATGDWTEMIKIFSELGRDDPRESEHIFERTIEIEEKTDLVERLLAREAIELSIDTKNALTTFSYSVLRSIQAIRFAFEWAELGNDVKAQFRIDAFAKFNPKFIASKPTQAEYKRELNVFKNRHQRVIKSRNEIRDIFLAFHAAVFMDVSWMPTANHTSAKTGRSPSFPATMSLLLEEMTPLDPELVDENECAFLEIAAIALGEEFTEEYIRPFLADHRYIYPVIE